MVNGAWRRVFTRTLLMTKEQDSLKTGSAAVLDQCGRHNAVRIPMNLRTFELGGYLTLSLFCVAPGRMRTKSELLNSPSPRDPATATCPIPGNPPGVYLGCRLAVSWQAPGNQTGPTKAAPGINPARSRQPGNSYSPPVATPRNSCLLTYSSVRAIQLCPTSIPPQIPGLQRLRPGPPPSRRSKSSPRQHQHQGSAQLVEAQSLRRESRAQPA